MTNTDLKTYALKNNLTNRALARKLGVEEAQISRWLRGETKISRAWAALLDSLLTKNESVV